MQIIKPTKFLKSSCLQLGLVVVVLAIPLSARAQTKSPAKQPPWQESLAPAAKGTHITSPKAILDAVRANADDCPTPDPLAPINVESFLYSRNGRKLIAIGGRGFCFCSATGNRAFWLSRYRKGKSEKILDTDMVQQFGFVHSTTNGLPDLVLWSHWSAFESGGAWWKFNGESYEKACTWVLTSQRQDEKGNWVDVKPYITRNSCKTTQH